MFFSTFYIHIFFFFFFNDTATTEIYTLSLHDALPISPGQMIIAAPLLFPFGGKKEKVMRSEEHTSELQSRRDLVCRLLLEKKKKTTLNIFVFQLHLQQNLVSAIANQ